MESQAIAGGDAPRSTRCCPTSNGSQGSFGRSPLRADARGSPHPKTTAWLGHSRRQSEQAECFQKNGTSMLQYLSTYTCGMLRKVEHSSSILCGWRLLGQLYPAARRANARVFNTLCLRVTLFYHWTQAHAWTRKNNFAKTTGNVKVSSHPRVLVCKHSA